MAKIWNLSETAKEKARKIFSYCKVELYFFN
jgi:hypothetical protein